MFKMWCFCMKILCVLLIKLSLISAQSTLTSCDANGQADCTSAERCSVINVDPLQNVCFPMFTAAEYESISVAASYDLTSYSQISGETDETLSFTGLENLVDGDVSTSVAFAGDSTIRYVTISFPSEYWVHDLVVVTNRKGVSVWAVMNVHFTLLQNDQTSDPDFYKYTIANDSRLPTFVSNFTFAWYAGTAIDIHSVDIFGLQQTPTPTAAPTRTPTSSTESPTATPTNAPSASPTPGPTSYPTPDVCQELIVRQSCCGSRGYFIQSDQINLRDANLTTCERTFTEQCCGTLGGYTVQTLFYGCDGQVADQTVCALDMFDPDVNTTDDIMGTIVAAEPIIPDGFDDFASYYASLSDKTVSEDFCVCDWTVNECVGEDAAVCGSPSQFDEFMSAGCWGNDTLSWNGSNVVIDAVSSDPCFLDIVTEQADEFAHFAWSPCSLDSFRGNVLDVQVLAGETVLNGQCYCEYAIRQCDVTEDPPLRQCADLNADGSANCDAGGCEIEVANPCCATSFDPRYEDYIGVTVITDDFGVPVEDTWKCIDTAGELTGAPLCDDLWSGDRKFTAETAVSWWYDMGELNSRCGCLYTVDECNLPTSSPTLEPTLQPTVEPSVMPSEAPTEDDGTGDDAFTLKVSWMVHVVIMVVVAAAVVV